MSLLGRKRASIQKETLERYLNAGFSYREMGFFLNAGENTIRRKMKEWGLQKKVFLIEGR